MPTFDLCSSCLKLIQPLAELSHVPLDFPQLGLLLPPTQIVVAELLGDVCLELSSQHANVRVTVDRPSRYSSFPALTPLTMKSESTPYYLRAVTSLRVALFRDHSPYSAMSHPMMPSRSAGSACQVVAESSRM
jgi:hypothetical protein